MPSRFATNDAWRRHTRRTCKRDGARQQSHAAQQDRRARKVHAHRDPDRDAQRRRAVPPGTHTKSAHRSLSLVQPLSDAARCAPLEDRYLGWFRTACDSGCAGVGSASTTRRSDITSPPIDCLALARSMGVPAARVERPDDIATAIAGIASREVNLRDVGVMQSRLESRSASAFSFRHAQPSMTHSAVSPTWTSLPRASHARRGQALRKQSPR
jgi:hypothetical protein